MLLSGNRPTAEQEHYLLYRLPMARGQQYIHAYAASQGADTQWADDKDDIFTRVQDLWKNLAKNENKLQLRST